jgi:CheY-like chemotaxis protein
MANRIRNVDFYQKFTAALMNIPPSKILIVDECRDDRYMFRRYLEQSTDLSYTILETSTDEECLALAREESPSCI